MLCLESFGLDTKHPHLSEYSLLLGLKYVSVKGFLRCSDGEREEVTAAACGWNQVLKHVKDTTAHILHLCPSHRVRQGVCVGALLAVQWGPEEG